MFGGNSSTEYDEIVAKTTDENLTSENWELIMDLCDKVGDEGQEGAHAVIAAILKRLAHRNPNVQLYTLSLSESLGKNLGVEIRREIASRAFTQGLEKLITDRNTHEKVRKRALGLIAEWAEEFENDESLGIMVDCYNNLKSKNYKFDQPVEPPPPTGDDIRRREEEELQRVLEMSKQEVGGRGRWTDFSLSSTSGAGPSGSGSSGVGRSSSATSSPDAEHSPASGYTVPKYQGGYAPARSPSPERREAEQRQQQLEYQKQLQAQQLQQAKEQQIKERQLKEQQAREQVTDSSPSIPAPTSPIGATSSTTPNVNIVTRVRALYTFEPTEPGELAFDKGDVIKVVDRGYRDWWRGQLKGRTGIFPVNYVEPMPEPTAAELAKESEQEAAVFSQAINVEKLLNMLRSFDPNKDNLADNEEIQELYRSSMALRPKIVKLIDKYSQKRADLVSMNETFLRARTIFDRMMEESLARHTGLYDQPMYRPTSQYGPMLQGRPASTMGNPQPFGWGPNYEQQVPPQQATPQPGYVGYPGPVFPTGPQSLPSTTPGPGQHPSGATYGSVPSQGVIPHQGSLLSQQGPGPVSQQPYSQQSQPPLQQSQPPIQPLQPQPQSQHPQNQVISAASTNYGTITGGGYQVNQPYNQQATPYPMQPQQQPQQQPPQQQPQQQPQHQPQQLQPEPLYQQPQPAQLHEQLQVPQLHQQPNQQTGPQPVQQPGPQAQPGQQGQPLQIDSVVPLQPQNQYQPQAASIVSPQTQLDSQPQPLQQVQPQVQAQPQLVPQPLEHQPAPQQQQPPQAEPQLQLQPPQPISGPPPYPYNPSYSYTDQNAQEWANYYARGGTDPTGSVYFISIPGVKEEATSFASSNQPNQPGYQGRPDEKGLKQGGPFQSQLQAQPFSTPEQVYQARPAFDDGDVAYENPAGATPAPVPTASPNMIRYHLSDNPVSQVAQPQINVERPNPARTGSGDNGVGGQPSSPPNSLMSSATAPLNVKRTQSPNPAATPSWVLPKKSNAPGFGPGNTNGGSLGSSNVAGGYQAVRSE